MASTKNSIYLRPSLDFDPSNPSQRNNLVSFSPDILPLYQTKITDVEQLISTYGTFAAQTVVPEEQNLVYVRGAATDITSTAKTTITVGSVTNELILWPQVLNAAELTGKWALSYTPGANKSAAGADTPGVTASMKSVAFKPPGRGGRHDTFVAVSDNSFGKFGTAANYQQLLKTVGSPSTVALLNAVVADPVFDVYSLSTRLRFFDDGSSPIDLELDLEAVGIPQGYSASIFSDDPKIVLAQTPIDPSSRIGLTIPATNGLDAMITVQVYKGDGAAILPDSSSISLVAHVNSGSGHVVESFVLGAEHIVFDSAIRISRSLVQGRGLGGSSTAQGFYFRDQVGDTDALPRSGSACHSPDIQPLGTSAVASIDTVLSTSAYGTDVSDQKGSSSDIVTESPNFIYLRGATNAATHVEFSLYAIPNSLLITPEMYGPFGIMELDTSNNPVLAVRELNAPAAGNYTVDTAFNWLNPPPVTQVDPNSSHYCLIAEYRLWAKDPIDKDYWPHQKGLPTGADVTMWILNNPAVAWRNVSWSSNPNAPTDMWQVNCSVPANWSATDAGYLALICTDMPTGGEMLFTSTATAGGTVLDISKTPISNPSQTAGVHFTGIAGPWNTTVTVQWWQGSGAARPGGATLQMQIQKVFGATSMLSVELGKSAHLSAEQAQWPLVIGPDYPNLERGSKGGSRKLLLGSAHPMPRLPAPGRYEHSNKVMVPPATVVALGGDIKGVSRV